MLPYASAALLRFRLYAEFTLRRYADATLRHDTLSPLYDTLDADDDKMLPPLDIYAAMPLRVCRRSTPVTATSSRHATMPALCCHFRYMMLPLLPWHTPAPCCFLLPLRSFAGCFCCCHAPAPCLFAAAFSAPPPPSRQIRCCHYDATPAPCFRAEFYHA